MLYICYKHLSFHFTGNTAGKLKVSVFSICGDATVFLVLLQMGFEGISIEEKLGVSYAKELVGNRVRIVGNISPSDTLLTKDPEAVMIEATICLEDRIDILAPGCVLDPPSLKYKSAS